MSDTGESATLTANAAEATDRITVSPDKLRLSRPAVVNSRTQLTLAPIIGAMAEHRLDSNSVSTDGINWGNVPMQAGNIVSLRAGMQDLYVRVKTRAVSVPATAPASASAPANTVQLLVNESGGRDLVGPAFTEVAVGVVTPR